jgi:nuclear protein localization family protein 4
MYQARKNQVQRWQLSLRAGAYRRYLGIGVQGTISDPLRRRVVSSRVRSWKQQTMLITQRLRYPINQEETRLPFLLWPAGVSNPWESGVWTITYLYLFASHDRFRHGELIFVSYKQRPTQDHATETSFPSVGSTSSTSRPWEKIREDAVDHYWRTKDGKISRHRDPNFCKHGANAMCDYCMPLEPYDRKYHQDHNIKHLSYHAYLRQLTPKTSSAAAAALPPLVEPDYRVKVPCPTGNHSNWPAGICTACQPSAITLQSQSFRMVDHLEIASMEIIDLFLKSWRSTGLQRFGWLIGRYEPYDEVPMGVKAIVEAIYEPPQEGEFDGLSLELPWEDESRIRSLAASASSPLIIVGYIFTDLDPTPEDRTKSVYKRHPLSFFLSSLEVLFAAQLQAQNRTPSHSSPSGHFASRLVTAVLTGTEDGAVDIAAYQVSEQAVGMLHADMIEASVDPGIMRVQEESRGEDGGTARYVPDVFFRYRNEYGIEVKKSAKPAFPVEYLLINVRNTIPNFFPPLLSSNLNGQNCTLGHARLSAKPIALLPLTSLCD